jgi:hypothetical protein
MTGSSAHFYNNIIVKSPKKIRDSCYEKLTNPVLHLLYIPNRNDTQHDRSELTTFVLFVVKMCTATSHIVKTKCVISIAEMDDIILQRGRCVKLQTNE